MNQRQYLHLIYFNMVFKTHTIFLLFCTCTSSLNNCVHNQVINFHLVQRPLSLILASLTFQEIFLFMPYYTTLESFPKKHLGASLTFNGIFVGPFLIFVLWIFCVSSHVCNFSTLVAATFELFSIGCHQCFFLQFIFLILIFNNLNHQSIKASQSWRFSNASKNI